MPSNSQIPSTHSVEVQTRRVVKTYTTWSRGEAVREATALAHLAIHAPGLAPELLGDALDAVPPWISMSRLSGQVRERPWTADELEILWRALQRLWAVPSSVLPPLPGEPAHNIDFWRRRAADQEPLDDPDLQAIYNEAVDWLASADAARLGRLDTPAVLGHGDPRAANLLVTNGAVSLIDFEDAGLSHRAYEVANTVEHLGNRGLGFEALLELDEITPKRDILLCRRLIAVFWFFLLYPGGSAAARNPPGTLKRQAARLAELLNTAP